MVNDLPKFIRHSYSGMYADDKIIWGQNQNLSILQWEIEADASKAFKWNAKWGFKESLNKAKSASLLSKKITEKDGGKNWRSQQDRSKRRENSWNIEN